MTNSLPYNKQTFAIASWQDIQQTSRRALGITQPRIPFIGSSSNRAQLDTSFYSTQYCLQRLIKHVLWNSSSNKESSFQEAICNYNLPRNSVQVLSLWETEKQRRRCHCLDQSEAYWLGGLVRTILNTRNLHNCFKFHMCTKMQDERDTTQFVVILHHPETPSHFRTCSQYFHSGTQYPKLLSLLPISKIQDSGRSLRLHQITYAPPGENPF